MSYLRCLCLSTYSGVQHILYCFACLRVVSCVSNVASFSSCPFLIAPSVFSNVYLIVCSVKYIGGS